MATTTNPLRVGIIGGGWPGERHSDGYQASGEAEIIAISDLEPVRRQAFAKQYNVTRQYSDYHDLLADPDIEAVSIALPNFLHAPASIAALKAGKHVLCEKPPATTYAEALAMAEAAKQAGRILVFGLQRRFTPGTEALRQHITAGHLGEIYHARSVWTRTWGVPIGVGGWFTDPSRAGGGALIDIGIHVFDIAWFLMGNPAIKSVSGQVYNKYPELTQTDDSAFALIRFADGRSLQLETSWVLAQSIDHMGVHLYGTTGGAFVNDQTLEIFQVNANGRTQTSVNLKGFTSTFTAQALNFIRAVRGDEPARTPAQQGVQLMQVIDAIYRSAKQGSEITL
jgi:predicted dehydrogenase